MGVGWLGGVVFVRGGVWCGGGWGGVVGGCGVWCGVVCCVVCGVWCVVCGAWCVVCGVCLLTCDAAGVASGVGLGARRVSYVTLPLC